MRFIGNKLRLIDKIYNTLVDKNISGSTFFDFFAGTASVGRFFKEKDYKVFSSDIMYFSFCLQNAYLHNNTIPAFEKLLGHLKLSTDNNPPLVIVVEYLNTLKAVKGFIYKNYSPSGTSHLDLPRMYFSDENAMKIDAIRLEIENFKTKKLISDDEYYILLSCLIETVGFYSNVAGVYAAFHKKWDPRAVKPLILRAIDLSISDKYSGVVYNSNSLDLIDKIDVDILYLDPPYNARQYAPNYHILETIAKYDNPEVRGVTGMRDYQSQKSTFCNANTAIRDLNLIAKSAKFKFLLLSYNNEGIMRQEDIVETLSVYGNVEIVEFGYPRFKSNSNGNADTKKHIQEQLYILRHN